MAVSALGLPLLLQASTNQLDSLFAGLSAGDQVRGRVVEVVGQDQAIVSLRGQNVVAQLPAGSTLQKGESLLLQVTQLQSSQAGKAASLTLRLLPPAAAPALAGMAVQAGVPSGNALPAQAVLEQSLSSARLPLNNVTLAVAQTLARLGAPLDPASLQQAVQATEALLANEAPPAATPSASPDPQAQAALKDALAQVKVAAQFSPSSQETVVLQQAVRELSDALQGGLQALASAQTQELATGGMPASTPPQAMAVPAAPTTPASAPANAAGQPAAAAAPIGSAPAPVSTPMAMVHVEQAVTQLLAQPTAETLQGLQQALNTLQASQASAPATAGGPETAAPAAGTAAPTPMAAAQPAAAPLTATPATTVATVGGASALQAGLPSLPARREALVQLLAQVEAAPAPIQTAQVVATAQALAAAYSDPGSASSQALVASVQAQQPAAQPAQILADARRTLAQVVQDLQAPGAAAQLPSPAAVRSVLQEAGQPVPQLNLNQIPAEHVAEAVAWLQARDLPPQRPLVEAVASWISQDQTALPATQRAIAQVQALPAQLLAARPSLGQALESAQSALNRSALEPDSQGLAQRLVEWSQAQGMDLEARLADPSSTRSTAATGAAPGNGPSSQAPEVGSGLKPALLRLDGELKAALKDPAAQAPQAARHLESALHETQAAIQAMNAMPLQAQPAPAFDAVHLPLPVWMNGQVGEGKLSVTWRHGRERDLDEKEPVNVAVALNTESLGPVKVLLQVWKGSASARVIGADPAAARFLAGGAAELRAGFAERTPFKLQSLDFSVEDGGATGFDGAPAGVEPAASGGFDLSA